LAFEAAILHSEASSAVRGRAPAQRGDPDVKDLLTVQTFAFVFLFVLFIGFGIYTALLQRRYFRACQDQKELALFAHSPAGLPVGTVRAILALTITFLGLFLIVGEFAFGNEHPVPQAMVTIFGTVLGFYFGSRAGAKGSDEELQGQVKDLQTQRDQAVQAKSTADASSVIGKVQKGIALTRTVASVLPPDLRAKYDDLAGKMETGLTVAQGLATAGDAVGAAAKANEVLDVFKSDNPVKESVVKAGLSFAAALGTSVPQVALVMAIVNVTSTLIGVAYQKWKARILRLPFSPAVIPLGVVDANTGFVLLLKSPILKKAFDAELRDNDRKFMEDAVKDFLREDQMDALWTTYKSRFESREQFEAGVEEFRRAAADIELKSTVDPTLLAPAGGYDAVMDAVDKIHTNEQAKADLDRLVVTVEGINEKGGSPKDVFDKVFAEVKP
jgi:hypothetical protein